MAGTRTLRVEILGDAKGLAGAFGKAESTASRFAAGIGRAGLAVGAAFTALGVGAVVGLAKVGESFDAAYDTIRTTTGATGEVLSGLEQSFKNVATSVAGVNFDQASAAIATLNQRTGQTGPQLEQLASQFLQLSKVSGTDVSTNVANLTRVFGDWGVSSEDQAGALDKIWRASQSTGAGIDQLSNQVVQFGAPLRQLGFGFEESLAMLGKWEKEGVNTELVLGGMKKALSTFAKEGEAAPEAFRRLTAEITAIQDPTLATQRAIEVFGARAGPDMAAAIREGRFAFDDYTAAILFGSETIQTAADDTDDWREKLQLLKNKALVALEPIAKRVFGAITKALDWVVKSVGLFVKTWNTAEDGVTSTGINGAIEKIAIAMKKAYDVIVPKLQALWAWFTRNLPGALKKLGDFFTDVFDGGKKLLKDLADAFNTNEGTILKVLAGVAAGLVAIAVAWNAGPGLIITGVVALVAGLLWAYSNVEWFRDGVKTALEVVKTAWDGVSTAAVWLWGVLKELWDRSEGLRSFLADAFLTAVNGAKTAFDGVTTAAVWLWGVIKEVWDRSEGFRAFLADSFRVAMAGVKAAWDGISQAVQFHANWVSSLWGHLEGFRSFLAGSFGLAVSGVTAVWNGLTTSVQLLAHYFGIVFQKAEGLRNFFTGAFALGLGYAADAFDGLLKVFDSVISKLKAIYNGAKQAVDWISKLPLVGGGGIGIPGLGNIPFVGGIFGNAWGGDVAPGQVVRVGERGRSELFVPNVPGRIVPHDALGGGGTIIVQVGGSVVTERQLVDAIHEGLLRKQRGGGLGFV